MALPAGAGRRQDRYGVAVSGQVFLSGERVNADLLSGRCRRISKYQRFFSAARGNKEHEDNLGEELIAICVHILSNLPGVADGKLCVLTDDKGAASKIDSALKRTNQRNRGSKIIIFSTPKLVQYMFQDQIVMSEDEMVNILSQEITGNIVVMGITDFDLEVVPKISLSCRDLVHKIMEPNGIKIVF